MPTGNVRSNAGKSLQYGPLSRGLAAGRDCYLRHIQEGPLVADEPRADNGGMCCAYFAKDRVDRMVTRGAFVAGAAVALATLSLPARALADASYTLWLQRMDTGESGAEPFSLDGKTVYKQGYYKLCALLRDAHVDPKIGDVQVSIRLVETLWAIQQYLVRAGIDQPIIVHSGYRTPQTNAQTEGAAPHSLHMYGQACDFDVPGVAIDALAGIAWACPSTGGVGYYSDGWVHVDTGPRRYWSG